MMTLNLEKNSLKCIFLQELIMFCNEIHFYIFHGVFFLSIIAFLSANRADNTH